MNAFTVDSSMTISVFEGVLGRGLPLFPLTLLLALLLALPPALLFGLRHVRVKTRVRIGVRTGVRTWPLEYMAG